MINNTIENIDKVIFENIDDIDGGLDSLTGDQEADTNANTEDNSTIDGISNDNNEDVQNIELNPFQTSVNTYLQMLKENYENVDAAIEYLLGIDLSQHIMLKPFVDSNLGALSLFKSTIINDTQKKIRRTNTPNEWITACENAINNTREFGVALSKISCMNDKGNKWRQLIAAMSAAVIVPDSHGGVLKMPIGSKKDIQSMSIVLQSYHNAGWMPISQISITEDAPDAYLGNDDIIKLKDGAPIEKKIIRARMIIEAITDQIGGDMYYISLLDVIGKIHKSVYFDPKIFKQAYEKGAIVIVESQNEAGGWICVDTKGHISPILTWTMARVLDKQEIDMRTNEIRQQAIEIGLIENGNFVLNCTEDDIQSLGGIVNTHSPAISDDEWKNIIISTAQQTSTLLTEGLVKQ